MLNFFCVEEIWAQSVKTKQVFFAFLWYFVRFFLNQHITLLTAKKEL